MVKTYYIDISNFKIDNNDIENFPTFRKEYLFSITDENRKKQSFFVWKLLDFAFKHNLPDDNYEFVNENGKISIKNNKFYLSLSHSRNMVAVSISNNAVGVDVQIVENKILKIKEKITNNLTADVEYLTRLWVNKESLYKAGVEGGFFNNIIFDNYGNKYVLSVCTPQKSVEFIRLKDL